MGEEKMNREIESGIGDIPEEGIYGISPTIDGDLLEVNWVAPQKGGGITRRQFVTGASAAGGLLVLTGCVPATETPPTATRTPEEVGLPPTPTLEVKATYTPALDPSPTATKEPTATATPEPATSTPEEATATSEPATPTPGEATPTPEPEEECEVQSCEPYQDLALYRDFSDEQSFSRLVPGTNKTFLVKDRQGGRMLIEVTEPSGAKWEAWADDNPGAYGPVGEAPPTPTPTPEKPPAAVCTEPHWKERTPDRKTGYINNFGDHEPYIFPDRPYVMWYLRMPDRTYASRRDARIIEIDRQNQIITFQLNDGSTRQRKFTPNTQVVMEAHDKYVGIPSSQARQGGGNFCDLEVGDVTSMLHPSEPESANPNPGLADLWGVFIVQ